MGVGVVLVGRRGLGGFERRGGGVNGEFLQKWAMVYGYGMGLHVYDRMGVEYIRLMCTDNQVDLICFIYVSYALQ